MEAKGCFSEGKIWEAAFFCDTQLCVYSAIRDMISESRFRFRGLSDGCGFDLPTGAADISSSTTTCLLFASFFFLASQKRLPSNDHQDVI